MGRGGDTAIAERSGLLSGRAPRRARPEASERWRAEDPDPELLARLEQMDCAQLLQLLTVQRPWLGRPNQYPPLIVQAITRLATAAAAQSRLYETVAVDSTDDPDEFDFLAGMAATKLHAQLERARPLRMPSVGFADLLRRPGSEIGLAAGEQLQRIEGFANTSRESLADLAELLDAETMAELRSQYEASLMTATSQQLSDTTRDLFTQQLLKRGGDLFHGFGESGLHSSEVVRRFDPVDNAWILHTRENDYNTACGLSNAEGLGGAMMAHRGEWAAAAKNGEAQGRQMRCCPTCAEQAPPDPVRDRPDWVLGADDDAVDEIKLRAEIIVGSSIRDSEGSPERFCENLDQHIDEQAVIRFAEEVWALRIDPLFGSEDAPERIGVELNAALLRRTLRGCTEQAVMLRRRLGNAYLSGGRDAVFDLWAEIQRS